jgi:hypothetical protein
MCGCGDVQMTDAELWDLAMGKSDLYPFTIVAPVSRKLDFVHRVVTGSRVERPLG